MRRWSLFLVPAAFVCGIVAVSTGRWLVALLSYVVALASTLNVVAALDPEGKRSPEVAEPWPPAAVLARPRRKAISLASAGLVLKTGLVLSVTATAGAVTGRLPDTLQDWVAGAVDRAIGLDLPAGRPPGERSDDGDPRATQGQPEQGPDTSGPDAPGQPPGGSGTSPGNPASPQPSRTPEDDPGDEQEGPSQPPGQRDAPGEGTLPTSPLSPPVPTTSAPPPPAPPIDQPLPQVPRPMGVDPLSPRR